MRPNGPVSIGQNVNLSCSYYSNPLDAEISWTKNTQTVDYSHSIVKNIVVKSERKLTEIDKITEDTQRVTSIMFENVTKTDEGEYTCNVTNTEGSASETVYLVVQDNDSETVPHSSPPYSGTYVKGFSMKEQMLYGVIVVLVVLVLIIMSLVGHVYIRIRYKQTNYTVPNTDVVRQTSFEIEMRDITSTDHDENDTLRNQPSLTNQEVTLDEDRHSDLSTTHSRSSSLHSNRSQNMNEDDYLHPYHSLVHNSMDVHAYAIVDRYENVEYEEIADVSKN
ncbi:fibroblast growth factor receptor 3-like [Mytilus edulis]|uniref:fibroblast growth factor receptor 3-like n=1 Tax=Mytilus edulis TaxID=6550 RepID=UPI0039F10376